ncbi:hypothetical protein L249_5797, partial [Ophiocordyceps polyrhachis-furcata BCC 54312]
DHPESAGPIHHLNPTPGRRQKAEAHGVPQEGRADDRRAANRLMALPSQRSTRTRTRYLTMSPSSRHANRSNRQRQPSATLQATSATSAMRQAKEGEIFSPQVFFFFFFKGGEEERRVFLTV